MAIAHAHSPKPFQFLRALVRWNEWYDSKIAYLLVCIYYVALTKHQPDGGLQIDMVILLGALCVYASFGHMINDFSDRQADLAVGKRNVLAGLPERKALTLVLATGFVGIFFALAYLPKPGVVALFGVAYALATIYSMPPMRLKERGAAGLLVAALAQRTVPCLIVFYALDYWDWVAAALCLLGTMTGIRYIVVHQILDANNDARAGLQTSGTQHGAAKLGAVLRGFVFPVEVVSLIGAIMLMGRTVPAVWAMGALYVAWIIVQRIRRPLRRMSPVSYSLLGDLYYVYWPVLLAAVLALRDLAFLGVLIFTIVWLFRNLSLLIVDAIGIVSRPAATPGR